MSALFNFQSLLTVILLLICTCTYVRSIVPSLLDKRLGKVGVHFGSVLGLGKEKVHTWLSVVFSWLSVSYFGHKMYTWGHEILRTVSGDVRSHVS